MSEKFLILRRIQRDITKMFFGLHVKHSYSSQVLMKCVFYEQILKVIQILHFMKIRLVEARLCYGDGMTDRHEVANSIFSLTRTRKERVAGKRQSIEY